MTNMRIHESRRFLNLHEYQSKALLAKYGVNVQKGFVAANVDEARNVSAQLKKEGADLLILKAQVLAGGRGKGHLTSGLKGGVQFCHSADEVATYTKDMIGYNLITKQTSAEGQIVNKVLVHEGVDILKESYLAIILDRKFGGAVAVCSTQGGMDIEEVAEKTPEAITMVPLQQTGMGPEQSSQVAQGLGFSKTDPLYEQAREQVVGLYKLFVESDATQVEINPLAVTKCDRVVAVDAKIGFDDNAAYRQRELFAQEDPMVRDQRELTAEKLGLNYIGLDGTVGCLVNGAGLAMATMDVIALQGGSPANFLDVGGSASTEQVREAFKLITSDSRVKSVLVNIFGGIMRCDVIAQGVLDAAKTSLPAGVKVVVRLQGTHADLGGKLLRENASGLDLVFEDDLDKAAALAVKFAGEA